MWQLSPPPAYGPGPVSFGAAAPAPAPVPVHAMPPAENMEGGKLGKQVAVHIDRLLDMPRDYVFRRPKNYRVLVFDEDQTLLATSEDIAGFQGWTPSTKDDDPDIDTMDVPESQGLLKVITTENLIYVQVEYAPTQSESGVFIGRCHVHRLDPRSQTSWPYMLSDMDGASANCGIHLSLTEIDGYVPRQRIEQPEAMHPGLPPQGHAYPGQVDGMPPQGFGAPGHMQAPPPRGHGMPGHGDGMPPQGSNMYDYYGHVEGLPPHGYGAPGHAEGLPPQGYGVAGHIDPRGMFGAPNLYGMIEHPGPNPAPQLIHPGQVMGGPMQASTATYSYTYTIPPVLNDVSAAPPPVEYSGVYDLGHPGMNHRSSDLIGHTAPGFDYVAEDDGLTEAWCKKPHWSITGIDGSEYDLRFKASLSEAWVSPLEAFDAPLFVDEHREFPDMDVSLVHRSSASKQFVRADHKQVSGRAKAGLPELTFDKWVPYKAPMELDPWYVPTPQLMRGAQKSPETGPLTANLASGKVQAERSLVPASFKDPCQSDKDLSRLDPMLMLQDFELQAIGQIDASEKPRHEKQVWLRSPENCSPGSRVDWANQEEWMEQFGTQELTIAVSCQRGSRGDNSEILNQDNFSITKAGPDTVLYVVCDGHGPFGHLCSFRVAQSLPKFVFEELRSRADAIPEQTLLAGFHDANEDLKIYASSKRINISCSGTTCAAVLRIGGDIQVAWLGDCGAVVGSVGHGEQHVDFMTPLHTTDVPSELARVKSEGASIHQISPHNAGRIFKPGSNVPGIFATRVLGDTLVTDVHGVSTEPDVKKTSFYSAPGVVVLASGGVWGMIPNPAAVLNLIARGKAMHGEKWHRKALAMVGGMAQKLWGKEEKQGLLCDDITCMLLHWERPAPPAPQPRERLLTPPPQPPPTVRDSLGRTTITPPRSDPGAPSFAHVEPPDVTTGIKSKPTTTHPHLNLQDVEEVCGQLHLVQPDPALGHSDILAQVASCIEAGEPFNLEKPVWFSQKGEPTAVRLENAEKGWLGKFQAANIQVSTICRKGQTYADPNQDNYSITSATGNRAIYVVCDGHGSLGHLASFRVAQSVPMLVLQNLKELRPGEPPENVVGQAIKAASCDLQGFGEKHGLDFSCSGTSCSVALRIEDRIYVGWLGDCRALVATVVGQHKKVDLMSQPHLVSNVTEYRRLCQASLSVSVSPDDVARVYEPGKNVPGLSISRALGDFSVGVGANAQGVISEAGMTKTSFAGVPGLVLLASGGMFEYADDQKPGEDILDALTGKGDLLESGPERALKSLCHTSQERWKANCDEYCEDISAILIHWVGPAPSVPMRTAQGTSQSMSVRGQLDPFQSQPRAQETSQSMPVQLQSEALQSQPRVVSSSEIKQVARPDEPLRSQPQSMSSSQVARSSEPLGSQPQAMPSSQAVRSWLANTTAQSGGVKSSAPSVLDARPRQVLASAATLRSGPTLGALASVPAQVQLVQELPHHAAVPIVNATVEQARVSSPPSTLPPSSPGSGSGEPRKFLQAQPRAGRVAAMPTQKAKVSLQPPPEATGSGVPVQRHTTRSEGVIQMPASSPHGQIAADKAATDVAPSRLTPVQE